MDDYRITGIEISMVLLIKIHSATNIYELIMENSTQFDCKIILFDNVFYQTS